MQGKESNPQSWNKYLMVKVVLLAFILCLVVLSGLFFYFFGSDIKALETIDIRNIKSNLDHTSIIYCKNPETNKAVELIRLYDEENRIWIGLDDIADELANAFIAIEDERFWVHPGIDFRRTLLAAYHYLTGTSTFGGSTITQQLIKNLTKDDSITINRKVREIFQALQLEKKTSKEDLLELYLNVVYLGEGCYGVQTAANTYFGKSAEELTLAEAASIAAITQNPNKYNPLLNPRENKKRQLIILNKMLNLKYIDREEYDSAREELLNLSPEKKEQGRKYASFIDAIILSVLEDLQKEKGYSALMANKLLFTGGLKIWATVDPKVQDSLDNVFYNDKNFPAGNQDEEPQSAAVILDPYTGQVKGIIGGREKDSAMRTLNRATQCVRQPGSSIKPLSVYAPAIEYGVAGPDSIIEDAPIKIGDWSPRNWYDDYWGKVTVRTAIEQSINVAAVKVLEKVGLDRSYNFLKNNLGITTLVESDERNGKVFSDKVHPALALGGMADGVSVIEIAAAYAPFVNKGIYNKPHVYSKIEDRNGRILIDKENSIKPENAMREQTAVVMTQLLTGVVSRGTATYAKLSTRMPVAGKTGTTSDDKDRWFVGYTPYYVGAVWFGFDYPRSTSRILAGRPNPSVVLWQKTMEEIHKNLPVQIFYADRSETAKKKEILHLKEGCIYEGEVKEGKANGKGMLTFADGNRYIGQFRNNQMNGKGILIYAGGARYEGDFKNNALTGLGVLSWPSGDCYSGEFNNGEINGQGTFTWVNGDCYKGEFKNGSFNGNGSMTWVNGDCYTGEWKDGVFSGYGTFIHAQGKTDCGVWNKGKIVLKVGHTLRSFTQSLGSRL